MEKLNVLELMSDLSTGDYGDRFCDYNDGYICCVIGEIADNNTDIYNDDLLEWAKDNYSYIEEALDELGTPTNHRGQADFMLIIQQGQYYAIERDLYENLEDNLQMFMYNYIARELHIEELTEEQNDDLLDFDFSDNNETLENLIEHIKNILIGEEV